MKLTRIRLLPPHSLPPRGFLRTGTSRSQLTPSHSRPLLSGHSAWIFACRNRLPSRRRTCTRAASSVLARLQYIPSWPRHRRAWVPHHMDAQSCLVHPALLSPRPRLTRLRLPRFPPTPASSTTNTPPDGGLPMRAHVETQTTRQFHLRSTLRVRCSCEGTPQQKPSPQTHLLVAPPYRCKR